MKQLENYYPDKAMMFLIDDGKLHGMRGTKNIISLSNQFSCIFARGESPKNILPLFNKSFKNLGVRPTIYKFNSFDILRYLKTIPFKIEKLN